MFIAFWALFALIVAGTEGQSCTKAGVQCTSDCSTVMICLANNPTPMSTTKCTAPTPYCLNGACSATRDASCISPSGSSFICTGDAVFPDPTACTIYQLCEGGKATQLQCPSGYVYNSKTILCQKGTTPCSKIDCSKATPAKPYIAYASNANFYAYCLNSGGSTQTFMFQCKQGEIFDTTTNECRFYCAAKGYFQHPANCNQYFYCSAVGAKASAPMLCAVGYVYDGTGCNKDASKCQYPPPAAATTTTKAAATTTTTAATTTKATATTTTAAPTTTKATATTTTSAATTTKAPATAPVTTTAPAYVCAAGGGVFGPVRVFRK